MQYVGVCVYLQIGTEKRTIPQKNPTREIVHMVIHVEHVECQHVIMPIILRHEKGMLVLQTRRYKIVEVPTM